MEYKSYSYADYEKAMKLLKKRLRLTEIFTGLKVFFKDHSETRMDVNLTEIDKPKIVREVEMILDKVTRKYKSNNSGEDFSTTHTPLTEWMAKGDFHE